MNISLLQFCF